MPTYAIGDVQGCWTTLERMLERLAFDPARDRLWFAGDLVNRGPDSLQVLRFVRELGDRATVVLGNHELHAIARTLGVSRRGKRDRLDGLLGAPDGPDLIAWLRHQPLLHVADGYALLHAGLLPEWTLADAVAWAEQLCRVLRGPQAAALLERGHGTRPAAWRAARPRRRETLALFAFTRMRMIGTSGAPDGDFNGPPETAPDGLVPWYLARQRTPGDPTLLFGHWAALGHRKGPGWIALDSGCVWGRGLTAVRLEDGTTFHEPTAPGDAA